VALDEALLQDAINHYLVNPQADLDAQHRFLEQECTFIDGSAGKRTAEFFLSLLH
jgi:hypothetical protein